jgi:voltage-gated potassium channel
MKEFNRIFIILAMFVILLAVGAIGYSFLLDVSLVDGLYMTIITISTVGYGEVGIMNDEAKFFTMAVIFLGVGTAGYTFTSIVVALIEGGIKDIWRNRKMERKIASLSNHYILCGVGETGEVVVEQFINKGYPFVVIEHNEEVANQLMKRNILTIVGDATEENVLKQANISKAKGLISALSRDVDNVYTVLSARQLNSGLYIISRAIDKSAPSKLRKAGANNTISTNEIGGRRMATLMMRPSVISFLDVITHVGDREYDLEDVIVRRGSSMNSQTLKELRIPELIGLIVLAIRKHGEKEIQFNPHSETLIEMGDILMVLGTLAQVNELRKIAHDDGERLAELFD